MKVAFIGPTLSRTELGRFSGITMRPPVAQGDIVRAVREGAADIGIVDGFFSNQPAVWHKEILWALDRGVRIAGASSMGALRAAELYRFGMVGVGMIFMQFASGELTDDDEVAVAHGDEFNGFIALSDAMVNIRATLHDAVKDAVLDRHDADYIIDGMKRLYYPARSYAAVLEVSRLRVGTQGTATLQKWLASSVRDQKKIDALALLDVLQDGLPDQVPDTPWTLSHTEFLQRLLESEPTADAVKYRWTCDDKAVFAELHRDARAYVDVRHEAAAVLSARAAANARNIFCEASILKDAARCLRVAHGLQRLEDFRRWLEAQQLSQERFEGAIIDYTLANHSGTDPLLPDIMLDVLRRKGQFSVLLERARVQGLAPAPAQGPP